MSKTRETGFRNYLVRGKNAHARVLVEAEKLADQARPFRSPHHLATNGRPKGLFWEIQKQRCFSQVCCFSSGYRTSSEGEDEE